MTTRSDCAVCYETYQNEGGQCPKLLPCSHTVCLRCLRQLAGNGYSQVKCPECRATCPLPQGGPSDVPNNRYLLENIELAVENTELAVENTELAAKKYRTRHRKYKTIRRKNRTRRNEDRTGRRK